MKIVEVFQSIQGEGKTIGKPSVFVRVNQCNLNCIFCDSKYASQSNKYKIMTKKQLIKKIKSYNTKHVIFTGGEPLLYKNQIYEIINKLHDYTFEIETNGTITPYPFNTIVQFNVSPKLANSGNSKINYDILKQFPVNNSIFKFVIKQESDMIEVLKLKKIHTKIPFYLMPEGRTRQEQIMRSPMVINQCIKYNMNFSPRLHILVWDDKRGV